MTKDEVLGMFREQAKTDTTESPLMNTIILDLAGLLAESRGRLSKENFDALVRIGGALYKEGHSQYQARTDVGVIMKNATDSENQG
ncbi:hypothetical protein [Noviherbaspirillum aerium]|uniref:hypothetical protein n=1 Tax=Noviherbaspirillum aerium TaxID=2588497 RepID=UPI00124CE845|nr:hypothetical protein [Noviherbaspirillum aerium]